MRLKLITIVFLLLSILYSSVNAKEKAISASRAANYIGTEVLACGKLMEVKRTSRFYFLNLDAAYPHQSLSIAVPKKSYENVFQNLGTPYNLVTKVVCAKGKVIEKKRNIQIHVNKPQNLSVAK